MKPERQRENTEFIKYAVAYGVLTPVDVWHENPEEGDPAIVIACGDMKQAPDRLNHCWDRMTRRAHLIFVNGGGHLLDAMAPPNQRRNKTGFVLDQIDEALDIIQRRLHRPAKRIIVYFDYPCGVAEDHDLSVQQSFQTAINVKEFLKERYPRQQISLKFYLDHPAEILGRDHPLILEHPNAPAFTFHFSKKATADYIGIFQQEHARSIAG